MEAQDPDGNISEIVIDISSVGGASKTAMVDNGTNGDANANDELYTHEISIPSIIGNGTYYLPFTITDDHTPNIGTIRGEISITVLQHNRQPKINGNPTDGLTLIEDQDIVYLNLTPFFNDPDESDVITYCIINGTSWDSQYRTAIADYRVLINHSLTVRPLQNKYGSESISVSVKDAAGLSPDFPHHITVTILPRNDQPYLIRVNDTDITTGSTSLTVYEDLWSSFIFTALDIDEDPLSYSTNITEVLPELRKNEDYTFSKGNGTLEIRPRNSQVGDYVFSISIDDGNDGMDSVELNLTIVNTNDPPFMDNISTQYVEQDEWLEILPFASDDDEVHGDKLVFSTNFSEYLPVGLLESNFFFNSSTGEFRFKPDKDTVATYETYIEVNDLSMEKYRRNFIIKVNNINDPPEAPVFEHSSEEGNFTVTFTALPGFDPDGDNLTYTWDFGDDTQNVFGQDLLTVEHTYGKAGNYTVRLWVSDGHPYGINRTIMNITITTPGGGTGPGNDLDGPLHEFSCSVTDHKGTVLDNALIRIEDINDPLNYFENFTDSQGKYRFHIPSGNYTITVTRTGFDTWTDQLYVNTKDIQKDIVLKKDVQKTSLDEKTDLEKTVANWVWLLLGLMVLLVVFGIVMILLIKKKSRSEKKEESPDEISPSQSTTEPVADNGTEAPPDMMIQPLAPLELIQYSQEGHGSSLNPDGIQYVQEEWGPPSEGKMLQDLEIAESSFMLVEGKTSPEGEMSETPQTPGDSNDSKLLDELLDEETPLAESEISQTEIPLQKEEKKSIQAILKSIIERDNQQNQFGNIPKPLKSGEAVAAAEMVESTSDLMAVNLLEQSGIIQKDNISSVKDTEAYMEESIPDVMAADLLKENGIISKPEKPREETTAVENNETGRDKIHGNLQEQKEIIQKDNISSEENAAVEKNESISDEMRVNLQEQKEIIQKPKISSEETAPGDVDENVLDSLRADLQDKHGIIPKPPKSDEETAPGDMDQPMTDILSVFDGLLEDSPKEKDNTLGTIPVERVAISRIDGTEMKICPACNQPFNTLEPECPSCSQRKGITLRCPVCASEVVKEMIFCKKCGTNLRNLKALKLD